MFKNVSFLIWKLLGGKKKNRSRVVYITEDSDWVIKRIGTSITSRLKSTELHCRLDTCSKFYFNSVIHFGSVHTFSNNGLRSTHSSNKLIVTIYHGNYGISQEMDDTINKFINCQNRLSCIIVANSIMRKRLISWGVPLEKIALIPIGVDSLHFKSDVSKRRQIRKELGIPEDAICIGSFQKDGVGWKEGLEPKLIKGPDIFIEAAKQLARKFRIHCLLTGPARGYVKNGLKDAGISFTHRFLKKYLDIVDFYNCLDLYLVTSREEGGPEALLESMAAGVPVVSSRVGMAPDIISNMENGFLVEVEDIAGIVNSAKSLAENKNLRDKIIQGGFNIVRNYDWDIVSRQYFELYNKIINGH